MEVEKKDDIFALILFFTFLSAWVSGVFFLIDILVQLEVSTFVKFGVLTGIGTTLFTALFAAFFFVFYAASKALEDYFMRIVMNDLFKRIFSYAYFIAPIFFYYLLNVEQIYISMFRYVPSLLITIISLGLTFLLRFVYDYFLKKWLHGRKISEVIHIGK